MPCVKEMNFYCNCYTALYEPINAAWAFISNQIMPKQSVKLWCNQSGFKYKNYKMINFIVTPVVHFVLEPQYYAIAEQIVMSIIIISN